MYREKASEEKEGERRLWERCVNRLRFSTVSIAAAREKRERWLSHTDGLLPLFCQAMKHKKRRIKDGKRAYSMTNISNSM